MTKLIISITALLTLSACAMNQPIDPVSNAQGIYTIKDDGFSGNPVENAAKFCDSQGKKIEILATSTTVGITGTTYPTLTYKCK